MLKVIKNSQMYTDLEMIKNSLEIMKNFYKVIDKPDDKIYVNFPPITFEYMLIGIQNTIDKGYKININEKEI